MSESTPERTPKMFPWWAWLLVAFAIFSGFVLTPLADEPSSRESSSAKSNSESEATGIPGLGETQETRDGIAITPTSVAYAVPSPSSSLIGEPLGSYATVTFRVQNNSSEPHSLFTRQITGTIGGSDYDVTGLTSPTGEYLGILANINPGLSLQVVAYIDIPPGKRLDTFNYESSRISGSKIVFGLR